MGKKQTFELSRRNISLQYVRLQIKIGGLKQTLYSFLFFPWEQNSYL